MHTERGLSLSLPGVDLLGHLLYSREERDEEMCRQILWPFESVSMALCSEEAASSRAVTWEVWMQSAPGRLGTRS